MCKKMKLTYCTFINKSTIYYTILVRRVKQMSIEYGKKCGKCLYI